MAWRFVIFSVFVGSANALIYGKTHNRDAPKCVVWHSQHKSGGATFEDILSDVALKSTGIERREWHGAHNAKFICDKETWSCEQQKCLEHAQFAPYKGSQVAMRGYVQVLQGSPNWGRAGSGPCVWATMFREPVVRLVSAYMYCKRGWHHDPLCGYWRLPPKNTSSLLHFSQHWGNYLFRELLWFPELHAFASSRPDFKPRKECRTLKNGRSLAPRRLRDLRDPWVSFKDELNGGDTLATQSGRQNFEKVKEILFGVNGSRPLYDVFGVAEHYRDSLRMFDEVMPLGFSNGWQVEANRKAQSHGSEDWKEKENKLLEKARRSPKVLQNIAADTELYNGVLKAFLERLSAFNAAHDGEKDSKLVSQKKSRQQIAMALGIQS